MLLYLQERFLVIRRGQVDGPPPWWPFLSYGHFLPNPSIWKVPKPQVYSVREHNYQHLD